MWKNKHLLRGTKVDSGAVLTPQEQQHALEPPLLDVNVYRSPNRCRQELGHVLLRVGFPVVPSSDVAKPRDFLVWKQLKQPVVINRLDDGTVAA